MMNEYNLSKIQSETRLSILGDRSLTQEQVNIAITGYIETNSDNLKALTNFLSTISEYIPQKKWLELFSRCCKYADSYDNFKEIIDKAKAIMDEVKHTNVPSRFFSTLEELYISRNHVFTNSELLKETAGYAYQTTGDARYMLFRDFAFVYTSNDKYKLTTAVNALETHLKNSNHERDKRCILFLQCLALTRILRINLLYSINTYIINEVYKECRNKEETYQYQHLNDTCLFRDYNLFTRMLQCNCPEIARIFESLNMYTDSDFTRSLHNAVLRTIENNKYSSEKPPIISQKIVFLSKTMLQPADSSFYL